VALLLGRDASYPEPGYIWPLAIKPALSSTFGETRSTAFHAGIDVKTWGKTGYPVRAIADGYIMRMRTSPWGYGRVVYQQLADGRIAVYAHLESFEPRLDARVWEAQERQGQYSVDLWLESKQIPVRQGQVIAHTGQSGAGPPHLHLEVRSSDNVPTNPLTCGYAVADVTPPTIRRLALMPVGLESTVEGQHQPYTVSLQWLPEKRRFENTRPVSVYGRVGVSVLSYDRAEAAQNKLAPYRHTLRVDGRTAMTATYDRVAYSDAYQVTLDRILAEPGSNDSYFALYRLPGNRLGFYEAADGSDGLLRCGLDPASAAPTGSPLSLAQGVHEVEVVAADMAGNESRARIQLHVSAPARVAAARLVEEGGQVLLEAEVSDPDDEVVKVDLSASGDGEKWREVASQQARTGSGPLTWSLPKQPRIWRVRVRDSAGPADWRTLARTGRQGRSREPLRLTLETTAFEEFAEVRVLASRELATAPAVRLSAVEPEGGDGDGLWGLKAWWRSRMTRSVSPMWVNPRQVGLREYVASVPLARMDGRDEGDSSPEDGAPTGGWVQVDVGATAADGATANTWLQLSRHRVVPGQGARRSFGEGEAVLDFAAGSAYAPLYPQGAAFQPEASGELRATSTGYSFGPLGVSFDRHVKVSFRTPLAPVEKLGVYADAGDGGWVFLGNELSSDSTWVAVKVRKLGRMALLIDEVPPTIGAVSPRSGSVVSQRRPRLRAEVDDGGAGIGREEDVVMELNGRRLISVYDPEAKVVEYRPRRDLAVGEHELVVRVGDRCGNVRVERREFRVK